MLFNQKCDNSCGRVVVLKLRPNTITFNSGSYIPFACVRWYNVPSLYLAGLTFCLKTPKLIVVIEPVSNRLNGLAAGSISISVIFCPANTDVVVICHNGV